MTPADLADRLERVPPGVGWPRLLSLLRWQGKVGKSLVNVRWYGECIYREAVEPRPKQTPEALEARRKVAVLTAGIGRLP